MELVARLGVGIEFVDFGDNKVFKECPGIWSETQWVKVVDDGISQAKIPEVYFGGFGKFITSSGGVGIKTIDNKALLKNIDIFFDGALIKIQLVTEF